MEDISRKSKEGKRMKVNGKTKLYGVIGNPIEHTLSPMIQNNLANQKCIDSIYVPFLVKENNLKQAIEGAYSLNVQGLNVTVPYKEKIIEYLVAIDKEANIVGAVNTLVRVEGGYKGYNTDITGLSMALRKQNVCLKDRNVIILGAGGAARAAAVVCMKEGVKCLYILNRTLEKAKKLAEMINVSYKTDIAKGLILEDYNQLTDRYIVFQTTTVGLHSKELPVLIDDDNFYKKIMIGIDIIYEPPITGFIDRAKKAGARVYNGLDMLFYQAVHAFELWNNIKIDNITPQMIFNNVNYNNIILVGFMGSGKSTVGRELSSKLQFDFHDTDKIIESMEQMSVADIFEEQGEEAFRNMETELATKLKQNFDRSVIATGGGIVMRSENVQSLKEAGKIVYLKVSKDNVIERLERDKKRPLLQVNDREQRIIELLEKRNPIYTNMADHIIDTDNKTVDEIVKEIMTKVVLEG
ncbi:MAG: shikimate dehydrogenase [Clostridiales bacterium]|jgi:shikimate dehydrogenase|nr:shikimate dehydrogenase [Clostridiales bacterium]